VSRPWFRDIKLSRVRIASAKKAIPQISARSAAEILISGPDGLRPDDPLREEPDRDREYPDLVRDELGRREPVRVDLDRLLELLRLEERLLLERELEGLRLIVRRLAIAQMFSLVPLLYHM